MNNKLSNIFKGDKVIWMVFFFLCIISIVEVYSASSQLTYGTDSYLGPVSKHFSIMAVGFVLMLLTQNIKCRYFKIVTPFMLIISILTLIYVFIAGHATNGAQRWIPLFGFQFQPSELAKGTMILATAQILSAMQTENGADRQAFKYILIVGATIIPLIFVENFSTAALLSAVVFMMMVIGRVPTQQLGKLLGVSVTLVGLFIAVVLIFGKEEKPMDKDKKLTEKVELATDDKAKEEEGLVSKVFHRFGTWKGRILKFVSNEEVLAKDYDLDENGQVGHANIAIASSNIVGKGPGNSESRDWLPQAFSDFIFAIIIEELGLLGAIVVAFLYIILLMRAGRIANRCENTFPAFLAMGLALLIVTQALFNMCVAVGLAPVTGQPLPLVSKGGTSTITSCIYIGMILSISRSAKKKQGEEDETSKKNIVKA